MTKLENALIWLYVKTWGKFGDHVIVEKDLWNFHDDDLERAIMGIGYPRKKSKPGRIQALTDLIMEKFEQGGVTAFRDWSCEIHEQIIETLPEATESKNYEVTFSKQQQLLLIADELKELEPQVKESFSRLSTLTADLMDPFKPIKIQKWDPTSVYKASVTDGIFKRLAIYAYARASNVMSTQSATDFEWSVRIMGMHCRVGIASQLKTEDTLIYDYDPNSILYFSNEGSPVIRNGKNVILANVPKRNIGDVIRFRFQPQTKKLLIDLLVKHGQYWIDLRDNVNYFPVVQSGETGFEAHLIA